MIEVAHLYWTDGAKIDEIADRLRLSRSTISRILSRAREEGVVTFHVHDGSETLCEHLAHAFGVSAVVIPTPEGTPPRARVDTVIRAAASTLTDHLTSGVGLAVSWGTMADALARCFHSDGLEGLRLVHAHGPGDSRGGGYATASDSLGRLATACNGISLPLPLPAFFDSAATRRMVFEEGAIRRLLWTRNHAHVLVASVGALGGRQPGDLYRGAHLSTRECTELVREGVVGDVAGRLLRADGTSTEIPANERSTAMTVHELRSIPVRIVIAHDPSSVPVLEAALKAQIPTHLVVDGTTARALLR
ncbi:sugar-binding domain-containing protein [Brooklawnia cerclae]|uniref:DNA-binding transcriptional regulator LsrR (DeoR family) n=1 Tax=Brooklawnia cerclae TaxID=349934 RepID=A0ABX0SJ16_9ACTN|nr:sugar-binding domain-containing protein [Brooklawnia cerclae]NIH58400.1 DNA-binding transcriptional regulator LsrR (DeoR family) [Brooklawnia cerclae]